MAHQYREGRGWATRFFPDVICEDEMGTHPNTVFYPEVSSCTTITARGAGGLFGVHLTAFTTTTEFGRLMERVLAEAGAITALSFVGCLNTVGNGWNASAGLGWPAQAATVRDMLGAGGVPLSYAITPANTTVDVRVASNGAGLAASVMPRTIPLDQNGAWQAIPLMAVA